MRHHRLTQNLSRFSSFYRATIRSLARSVLIHQGIVTTRVRAGIAQRLVEKLITLGKDTDSLAARRRAFSFLGDHALVKRLFVQIAPMFTEKAGGYTRIVPYKRRRGDNAELVVLELSQKIAAPAKREKEPQQPDARLKAAEEKKKAERLKGPQKPESAAPPEKEKHRKAGPQKPGKGFGGFGRLFKRERDSL